MSDLIRKGDVINALLDYNADFVNNSPYNAVIKATCKDVIDILSDLPSVNNWVPVSKKLPKKKGFYLTTLNGTDLNGERLVRRRYFSEEHKKFACIGDGEVIAWMELPEPFKGE